MAKSPVADGPREVTVQLRLTPAEIERIDHQRNNTSRAAYLRSLIPVADPPSGETQVADDDGDGVVAPVAVSSGRHFHSPGELIDSTTSNGRQLKHYVCAAADCAHVLER
jgi:hypothetical protein